MAGIVAGCPTSIFRLAAGLLTIKGRQGENRGQASRKSPRNLREKISEPTSLSSRSLLANPQLPRQAQVGVVQATLVRALPAKQLELGREIVPGARRIGVVDDVTDPKAHPQRKESKR
jgi:hypothetical protein